MLMVAFKTSVLVLLLKTYFHKDFEKLEVVLNQTVCLAFFPSVCMFLCCQLLAKIAH